MHENLMLWGNKIENKKMFSILVFIVFYSKVVNSYPMSSDVQPACNETEIKFNGKCYDVFDEAVCQDSPGMRLFEGEDGEGYCDCLDEWIPHEGKCYQEFTFAPTLCKKSNEILRYKDKMIKLDFDSNTIFFPDELEEIETELRNNFTCVESPCPILSLPHSSTWNLTENTGPCHSLPENANSTENLKNCELALDYYYFDYDETEHPLKCCDPSERTTCYYSDYDEESVLFSVIGPLQRRSCRQGCIYSRFRNKCVGRSRGRRNC